MWMPLHAKQKITKLMTILLVQDTVTFLNMYPSKNGISSDLRPAAIILGSPNPDYKKLSIAFVAYEKVCIGTTNSTKYRTVGEIVLHPEYERSGKYFMSLDTGKHLYAYISSTHRWWGATLVPHQLCKCHSFSNCQ